MRGKTKQNQIQHTTHKVSDPTIKITSKSPQTERRCIKQNNQKKKKNPTKIHTHTHTKKKRATKQNREKHKI